MPSPTYAAMQRAHWYLQRASSAPCSRSSASTSPPYQPRMPALTHTPASSPRHPRRIRNRSGTRISNQSLSRYDLCDRNCSDVCYMTIVMSTMFDLHLLLSIVLRADPSRPQALRARVLQGSAHRHQCAYRVRRYGLNPGAMLCWLRVPPGLSVHAVDNVQRCDWITPCFDWTRMRW